MYKKRSACCIFHKNFDKYSYLFLFFFTYVKIIHNYSWRSRLQSLSPRSLSMTIIQRSKLRTFVDNLFYFSTLHFTARVPIFSHFLSCITEQINGNTFLNAVIFDRLRIMYTTSARNVSRKKCFVIWIYFETLLILNTMISSGNQIM